LESNNDFAGILSHEVDFMRRFRERVPVHTYNSMFNEWWYRSWKVKKT
jgi:hypothetical protein